MDQAEPRNRFRGPRRRAPRRSTSRERPVDNKIFVSNLPKDVTEQDLRDLFNLYQPLNIDIVARKGWGFVRVKKAADVKKACDELNDTEYKGQKLAVVKSESKRRNYPRGDLDNEIEELKKDLTYGQRRQLREVIRAKRIAMRLLEQNQGRFGRDFGGPGFDGPGFDGPAFGGNFDGPGFGGPFGGGPNFNDNFDRFNDGPVDNFGGSNFGGSNFGGSFRGNDNFADDISNDRPMNRDGGKFFDGRGGNDFKSFSNENSSFSLNDNRGDDPKPLLGRGFDDPKPLIGGRFGNDDSKPRGFGGNDDAKSFNRGGNDIRPLFNNDAPFSENSGFGGNGRGAADDWRVGGNNNEQQAIRGNRWDDAGTRPGNTKTFDNNTNNRSGFGNNSSGGFDTSNTRSAFGNNSASFDNRSGFGNKSGGGNSLFERRSNTASVGGGPGIASLFEGAGNSGGNFRGNDNTRGNQDNFSRFGGASGGGNNMWQSGGGGGSNMNSRRY